MFQMTLTLWLGLKQWGHGRSVVLISSEIKSFQSGLSEEDNQDGKTKKSLQETIDQSPFLSLKLSLLLNKG